MTTIPWSDLIASAGAGFEPLPNGDYDVQCQSAEATKSSNGKDMFKCVFVVTAGPHAGRKIWNNFTISPENPNALGFFFQHMAALGLDRTYFAQNPSPEHVAQVLVGRVCRMGLACEFRAGQNRNNVTTIVSAGAVAAAGIAAGVPQAIQLPQAPQIPQPQVPQVPQPQPVPTAPAPVPQMPQIPVPQPQVAAPPPMPVAPVPQVPVAPAPQVPQVPVAPQPAVAAPVVPTVPPPPAPETPVLPANAPF